MSEIQNTHPSHLHNWETVIDSYLFKYITLENVYFIYPFMFIKYLFYIYDYKTMMFQICYTSEINCA